MPVGAYRVLHYIGAHAPTLGAALERVVRYFPLIDARVAWQLAKDDREVALVMTIPRLASGVPRAPAEYTFAAIVQQTRASTGIPWSPRRVDFQHHAPPEVAARHRRAFGAPCAYGAERTALVIDAETGARPVARADPSLLALLDQHAGTLVANVPRQAGLVARLRSWLAERMQAGEPIDIAQAARALGLGARTLQRRLDEAAAVAGGPARRALGRALDQDLDDAALHRLHLVTGDLVLHGEHPGQARLLDRLGHAVAELFGARAGALAVLEGEDRVVAHLVEEAQRVFELGVGLAGEADELAWRRRR